MLKNSRATSPAGSAVPVSFIVQFPLQPSEPTNHSPVPRLCAKKVGCPQPDLPRVPETVLVVLAICSNFQAPSCPHSSYSAEPTSKGVSPGFSRSRYVGVFHNSPDQGETLVSPVALAPVFVISSQ